MLADILSRAGYTVIHKKDHLKITKRLGKVISLGSLYEEFLFPKLNGKIYSHKKNRHEIIIYWKIELWRIIIKLGLISSAIFGLYKLEISQVSVITSLAIIVIVFGINYSSIYFKINDLTDLLKKSMQN